MIQIWKGFLKSYYFLPIIIIMFLKPIGSLSVNLEDLEKELAHERSQSDILLQRASDLDQEVKTISQKLVTSAAKIQEHEKKINQLETAIRVLRVEETERSSKLNDQQQKFALVLMSLQRLARFPPEALIAQPLNPSDIVRSAILLRAVVPEVEQRAENLRQQVAILVDSRSELSQKLNSLESEQESLSIEGRGLRELLEKKKLLRNQTAGEYEIISRRAEQLGQEAKSLRELIVGIQDSNFKYEFASRNNQKIDISKTVNTYEIEEIGEAQKIKIPIPPEKPKKDIKSIPFSMQRGKLPFPVIGSIIGHYGENNENGVAQRGIQFITRPAAQVIAPYEGQVVFVGEFRGYGQLLIIEHRDGYHSLLAGMARIDSSIGQWVLIGEPVGIMETTINTEPILYVELRRDGQPINPLPWLSSRAANSQG